MFWLMKFANFIFHADEIQDTNTIIFIWSNPRFKTLKESEQTMNCCLYQYWS